MNDIDLELPSNRKFGYFFAFVFILLGSYFYFKDMIKYSQICLIVTFVLCFISIFSPKILYPFNLLWMKLGYYLGLIVSPVVLGVIFFVLITPMAFFLRIKGRDELRLKLRSGKSHWIYREKNGVDSGTFENQF